MTLHFHGPVGDAEKALAAELNRLHLKTQIIRLVRVCVTTFGAQLALMPHGAIGPKAAAAVAVSVFETAVRETWPSLPLNSVIAILDRFRKTPAPVAVTVTAPEAPAPAIPAPRGPEAPATPDSPAQAAP